MTGKLFLIDGHALIFKMYYAFLGRPMINSKGLDTSILYGFTKYLLELIDKEKPTHMAVAFDPPGGTFRNEMYPEYKANRAETPQLVIDALEPLTEIVKAFGIPVVMKRGFEADDVIGSMAGHFAAEGFEVYMVTPDKDYGQLVGGGVFQYKPLKGGENEILDAAKICAKYGISDTSQVIEMLTICGDSADNVPGVKGVGEVGAAKLLAKYSSVEGIYAHLDELTPRQRGMFEEARGHIALSHNLVTIKTDIPTELSARDLELSLAMTPQVADLFSLYEFNSLRRHFSGIVSASPAPAEQEEKRSGQFKPFTEVPADRLGAGAAAVLAAGDLLFVAVGGKVASGAPDTFRQILSDPSRPKFGCSLKELFKSLQAQGLPLEGKLYDISLMHYLLDPEKSHQFEVLASSYLGVDLAPEEKMTTGSLFGDDDDVPSADHNLEASAAYALGEELLRRLRSEGLEGLYDRIEEPLIRVLARMEATGVKVDVDSLQEFAASLRLEMRKQEALVREIAGEPGLNVASPKQVGEVLFEKMKLAPGAKKPKKGSWPTDEETLLDLADKSPIIDAILEYRGTRKLLSTYIEPFPGYISPSDGRVHTTFNQALTSTGRLSSSNPNLQNIPIRTEQGRRIREAFVPERDDFVMMSADYSQIELRIMAHLCGDEHLIEAFRSGTDVHAATAAKIFGIPIGEVSAEQRRVAKTANFGIMYGISAFGLAQRLRCPRGEAKKLIDDYFESFPSIRSFISGTVASARECGYVETLFGRRRYIPDINAANATLRALAERNAVNAPIQGTAADIIKLAMTGVDRSLREEGLKARMVLQIHDELLLEVPAGEIGRVSDIVVREMEGVMQLSVPLTVECNYGKTWLEAH